MNRKFIFKYEPQASVKEMFTHLGETIQSGKKYIQPENFSIINDLRVINRIFSKIRLELFYMIREKRPKNIQELSFLLQRDYANVWRDCQILANCGIIKLEKKEKEIKPVFLYDQIVIDWGIDKENRMKSGTVSPHCLRFKDSSLVFKNSIDMTQIVWR